MATTRSISCSLRSALSAAPRRREKVPSYLGRQGRFSTTTYRKDASRLDTPHGDKGAQGSATVDGAASLQGTDLMTGERTVPPGSESIDASRLVVEKTNAPRAKPDPSGLVFGRSFTDHMLVVPWNSNSGWASPKIQPYQPLVLEPSATCFHYAPCAFEGMKAYMTKDGAPLLFRPDKNMQRLNNSAARLALPTFSSEQMIELLKTLVNLDKAWIPTEPGYSLYVRPTLIGTQAGLGVGASSDALLFVIMSPCGPYYPTGFKPVSLFATTTEVRAWPGGTGNAKIGGNYAPGVVPQLRAAAQGYQQILWLFGPEHELTEVGTMNLMVVLEADDGSIELVTPPLGDTVLPGVTRDSILSLARGHASGAQTLEGLPPNLKVSERKITMPEVARAAESGKLKEIFGVGTAVVVSSVERIGYDGTQIKVPVGKSGLGDVAAVAYRELVGRQTGAIPSDWAFPCS